jgi:A/G-specific adenine glycosylase
MLQQTQVPRVIPKYEAFLKSFPTLQDLARAERTEVLRHWQGLGYNSRAVRLHALAKMITALPKTSEELLKLPGIGPYTAGALVIFAHDKPAVSVDVNVRRVLTRIFWDRKTIVTPKQVDMLALDLISAAESPHHWHAALMDFGSAICNARNPACDRCPISQCKSKGPRLQEASLPKQSKFLGSKRWWRGQILKLLLTGPVQKQHLIHKIKQQPTAEEVDLCELALADMIKEDLVADGKVLKLK